MLLKAVSIVLASVATIILVSDLVTNPGPQATGADGFLHWIALAGAIAMILGGLAGTVFTILEVYP